jgi:hypothetical protein
MVATKLSLLTGLLAAGSLLAEASPVDKRAGCTITSLADGTSQATLLSCRRHS